MILRPYQEEARAKVYQHLGDRDDNPCVVIPTGGGKSPLMAAICSDSVLRWGGRVLVLAHVRELLEQTADKLGKVCPEVKVGIYSAGLNSRDIDAPVIVAGIQSVYKRACELGPFDLVLVDEAHLIPADGEGMYQTFLKDTKVVNPAVRVVGFTATPYRLKSGLICTPDHFLNHVCYEVGIPELIVQGYLSPLITKAGIARVDTTGIHVRSGEFVAAEIEDLMDQDILVESACQELVDLTRDRHAILIFTTGVKHGRHVQDILRTKHGVDCGFVSGETPAAERDATLKSFRDGELKYLTNINVLTTGFDAPHIDCVVMLRPTMSPGLYYQMVGRGFRLHPGKANCLVLDFGGNIMRHGPVDDIQIREKPSGDGTAPAKECPECHALIAAGYGVCPQCGYVFPPPNRQAHDTRAAEASILSGEITVTQHEVLDVTYSVHIKKKAAPDAPRTMRVDYKLGLNYHQSEFICFEHQGFARQKAVAWWTKRSPDPVPLTADEAVELADAGALCQTETITIRSTSGKRFDEIIDYVLGSKPEPVPAESLEDDEVPF